MRLSPTTKLYVCTHQNGMTALAHAHERFLEGSQPDESYEYLDSVTDADFRAHSYPAIVSLLTATNEQVLRRAAIFVENLYLRICAHSHDCC